MGPRNRGTMRVYNEGLLDTLFSDDVEAQPGGQEVRQRETHTRRSTTGGDPSAINATLFYSVPIRSFPKPKHSQASRRLFSGGVGGVRCANPRRTYLEHTSTQTAAGV